MTVVSEMTEENLPSDENGNCVEDAPSPPKEKKVSTTKRIPKKSIQQKIYRKGKVKFDKSAKSYVKHLPRIVERNGSCNIVSRTITGKRRTFCTDFFISLIETKWRLVLPCFGMSVVISWIVFAGIYFGLASARGDFNEPLDVKHVVCVANSHDFLAMVLFSMETQTTIGYGSRYVTEQCPGVIIFVMIQSIWGALLQALLTGIVIVKIQKPTKRGNTILFSKNVCICEEDDGKYLYIRVADIQKSNMIETRARAVCVVSTLTTDGDFISHFRHDIEFKVDKLHSRIQLQWPVTFTHRLQPHSPLYNMDEDDLRNSDLELIILMDGVIESTGMTVQARTSYIPSEFQWQHRFKPMIAKMTTTGACEFDLSDFHETEEVAINVTYAPYTRLRRLRAPSKLSDSNGRLESGYSEGIDTDESSICSDFSVFDSKNI